MLNINLNLNFSSDCEHKETKVSGMLLNAFSIEGKPSGLTIVENTKINNIFIRNFLPVGNFELFNISSFNSDKPLFEVHRSNLDTTFLNYVNLSDYEMVFFRSKITNLSLTAVNIHSSRDLKNLKISSRENIHYHPDIITQIDYKILYELFIQFKLIFEKQGNTFEALKMKSTAQYFLGKMYPNWFTKIADYIESQFPYSSSKKTLKLTDVSSILTLNRFSNNNGISISIALMWSIILIVLFHTLNIYSHESIEFGFRNWSELKDIVSDNFKYIFSIANPTHRISSLAPNESELTSWTYAVSFFSRICIGYIYYQFIVAFRRFGK